MDIINGHIMLETKKGTLETEQLFKLVGRREDFLMYDREHVAPLEGCIRNRQGIWRMYLPSHNCCYVVIDAHNSKLYFRTTSKGAIKEVTQEEALEFVEKKYGWVGKEPVLEEQPDFEPAGDW